MVHALTPAALESGLVVGGAAVLVVGRTTFLQSLPRCLSAGLGVAALVTSQVSAQPQACDPELQPPSTPTSRFTDHGDGTVTDNGPTQLMWMRCAAGQQWRGNTCEGNAAVHSWPQAQALATKLNESGHMFFNDWRVPSLRELATVTERQCLHPRINLQVFPATPSVTFWTGSASARRADEAYVLDFASAGVAQAPRNSEHAVRLVRSAP